MFTGEWLYATLPANQRLADIPLGSYIANAGVALVVCSGNCPINHPESGIWVYRDWNSDDPDKGDLRVFDWYSDTKSYDEMKDKQLDRYNDYDGKCKEDPNVSCDLFLLSWTLTPATDVWGESKEPNRKLGAVMSTLAVPNQHGQIPNLLYVDYVEYARVTDVAMLQNGVE